MNSIYVKDIKVYKNRVDVNLDVSDSIREYFVDDLHFFAEYTVDISSVPKSVLAMPILLNIIQLSWIVDAVVWIEEIDKKFYNSIPVLKNAFRELHPNMTLKGTLIAAKQVENFIESDNNKLLLFTGGIDATSTLIRIFDKKPMLFNTNGWYLKNSNESNEVYDADYNAISTIASNNGLQSEFVKSNFAKFIKSEVVDNHFCRNAGTTWWFGFQHSLAFIGCAMVIAYAKNIDTIYIASSYTFGQYIRCVSDPRIDSCIECAGIKTIHDGYELSRQDKVKLIVNYQKETDREVILRVCSFNTRNCCECEKCFRSMLALVAEGADNIEKFGFDLDDTLLNKLKLFIEKEAMELDNNHIVFWNDIIERMKSNYANLHYKEVYDYLKDINLYKARKRAIWNHYTKDFWQILKRKLFLNIE